jgi:uroporphyrin-III C-methyltransferase/precorrin-2 dehydrogenase/sirohydrochlorin ferrochelatase
LQEADVVLHDRLVGSEILALARRDARLESVAKRAGDGGTSQASINERMVSLARSGLRVVRLKGGDPFVFGRGGEEIEHLRSQHIPYEVVPGVTAALACAAHAGIPLTDRRYARSVTFLTAHSEAAIREIDWNALAGPERTLVLYMAVGALPAIVPRLLAAGLAASTCAALVENGATARQRVIITSLGALVQCAQSHALLPPALVIIGGAASAAPRLHWFGAAPIEHASALGEPHPAAAQYRGRRSLGA